MSWFKATVVCLDNRGYEVSLRFKGTYAVIPDRDAEKYRQIRVVDESGDDYLYPEEMFSVTQ
jgi:hypothetical protein